MRSEKAIIVAEYSVPSHHFTKYFEPSRGGVGDILVRPCALFELVSSLVEKWGIIGTSQNARAP